MLQRYGIWKISTACDRWLFLLLFCSLFSVRKSLWHFQPTISPQILLRIVCSSLYAVRFFLLLSFPLSILPPVPIVRPSYSSIYYYLLFRAPISVRLLFTFYRLRADSNNDFVFVWSAYAVDRLCCYTEYMRANCLFVWTLFCAYGLESTEKSKTMSEPCSAW